MKKSRKLPLMMALAAIMLAPQAEAKTEKHNLENPQVKAFYDQRIKKVPRVTIIVGNKKKLNFEQLSRYGRVVELQRTDFFKQ